MARSMANIEYRNFQWEHRYDDHIAPINRFVDGLNRAADGLTAPYVAPICGGVGARMLCVLRDPGPQANAGGFLCIENDDSTAETMCKLIGEAGIDVFDMVPWNAYPWYINRNPRAAELEAGVEPLRQIIDMMPLLKVVVLHGVSAKDGWRRFVSRYPDIVSGRNLNVIGTYHTSRQAFRHKDRKVREERWQHLRNSLHTAARILNADKVMGSPVIALTCQRLSTGNKEELS